MQVLIDLHAKDKGVFHSNEKARRDWEVYHLYLLLSKLEDHGYEIHSFYGSFIFDNGKREAVDIGEPGEILPASIGLAQSVYETGGKMAIVLTEEKYVVFTKSFFPAVYYFIGRQIRPLSIYRTLKCFDTLFVRKNEKMLHALYSLQFKDFRSSGDKPQ